MNLGLQLVIGVAMVLCVGPVIAQPSPYLGYAYPAGGQQGTTIPIKIGGQRLSGAEQVVMTGEGVTAKIERVFHSLSNQEITLLREQLNELKKKANVNRQQREKNRRVDDKPSASLSPVEQTIRSNLEARLAEFCNRPASASIADLVFINLTIAADAVPGPRELRLVTSGGITNPLIFHVGQVNEVTRPAMLTSSMQVLGKEEDALRKRPASEAEVEIQLPCTVNGQVASGEINWYRFKATKGERLVISCSARELIPFIADAVPGWFQPVISVLNAEGEELSYNDDFGFRPDPVVQFEVPADGEYRFRVFDAIYRGREDFVYRITIGRLPLLTSLFPLGGNQQTLKQLHWYGYHVDGGQLKIGHRDETTGIQWVSIVKDGIESNRVAFQLDEQAGTVESEPNNTAEQAAEVSLPTIIDGRIDTAGDWDVYRVDANANETIVAEITARRLNSPLDSILKITDAAGKIIAVNDDHADIAAGLNTHHADSYAMFQTKTAGPVYVHVGDTARNAGETFAYRLRISRPQPDFALRVTPSAVSMPAQGGSFINVYAIRQDGFDGEIRVQVHSPEKMFSLSKAILKPGNDTAKVWLKTNLTPADGLVDLVIEGQAMASGRRTVRRAGAADDRMQAFLWRHLVPAESLTAMATDRKSLAVLTRQLPPPLPTSSANVAASTFTKQQVAARLKQLRNLFDAWLLTDEFYRERVAECEAVPEQL
jgi:hypothetical protein